jgi:outer membrane protein assembly factor BamB
MSDLSPHTVTRALTWLALMGVGAALGACSEPTSETGFENPVLWSAPTNRVGTRPAITSSLVVFGNLDGSVQALSRETGELVWRRTLIEDYAPRGTRLVVAGGLVLVPMWDLWALHSSTGYVAWRFPGPDGSSGVRVPVATGDTLFTASRWGWASSIDARTGQAHWHVDLAESVFPPAVSQDLVIYATRSWTRPDERSGALGAGHLVALRRGDGTEAWRFPLPDSVGFPGSGGAIGGGVVWQDRVIVGTRSAWVLAVRLEDGELIWATPNGNPPYCCSYTTKPVLVDDVAVFGRQNNLVEGWDVRTGERVWTWSVPSGGEDLLQMGSHVYAIDGPITIGVASGERVWEFGGYVPPAGGSSYYSGNVAEDGTIYAVNGGPFVGNPTSIRAIRPPITP